MNALFKKFSNQEVEMFLLLVPWLAVLAIKEISLCLQLSVVGIRDQLKIYVFVHFSSRVSKL